VAGAAAAGGLLGTIADTRGAEAPEAGRDNRQRINIFSKHLQWLDYKGMAETAAEIGFDGVDLTVRPKGHVLPGRVEDDLPRAVEAVKKAGLRVEMITTAIADPRDERTRAVLKTAGRLGIRYYRMGYYHYDKTGDIVAQLNEIKPAFRDLAAMSKQYGLAASYQNHAGTKYIGASLWDLYHLIHDLDRRWIGSQFDIRHAVVEGGTTWPVTMRLLAGHINTLVAKDFVWARNGNAWVAKNVPLGQGMVDFPEYAAMVGQLNLSVPVSLHLEHPIGGAEHGARELSTDKSVVLDAMRRDLDYCRRLFVS
jgi:sugar phosphate isomerase/epimerase